MVEETNGTQLGYWLVIQIKPLIIQEFSTRTRHENKIRKGSACKDL
jgi:hypothetical protein